MSFRFNPYSLWAMDCFCKSSFIRYIDVKMNMEVLAITQRKKLSQLGGIRILRGEMMSFVLSFSFKEKYCIHDASSQNVISVPELRTRLIVHLPNWKSKFLPPCGCSSSYQDLPTEPSCLGSKKYPLGF
jgi:hypothetical protein